MIIASFACTDGGFTGRSLSLVSRRIHLTSEPFRLQSISLHSARDITAFRNLLNSKPPHEDVVRNLFISPGRSRRPSPTGETEGHHDMIKRHMSEILATVAPHVRILTVVACTIDQQQFHLPDFPDSFPMLEELHIRGGFGRKPIEDNLPKAEQLRRLHLAHARGRLFLPSTFTHFLSRSYPHLTHLRIFGPRNEICCGDLFTAIEKLVHGEVSIFESKSSAGTGSFPSTLAHVSIIPGASMPRLPRSNTTSMYQSMVEKLQKLASKASDCPLVLPYRLKRYNEYSQHEYDSLERWWLETINGGNGCWPAGSKGNATNREPCELIYP